MKLSSTENLRRLGAGAPIADVCADAGISRTAFDAWWTAETAARVLPEADVQRACASHGGVEIRRDRWGVAHVFAVDDARLFFGLGFAMATDRLWQMDYLRRKALGTLAEILGPEAVPSDTVARTVGLPGIARAQRETLRAETLVLLGHFADGVNACIAARASALPIEFSLLDYAPAPWSPACSLAVLADFRWYLTGRLHVIAIPELARRALRNDVLFDAFLTPEAGLESIVPHGAYVPRGSGPAPDRAANRASGGTPDEPPGSNNWVAAGALTATGRPLLASDPHIAFGTTSCWHEVRLRGGSFDVAGMTCVGVPALIMGRNPRVAWGITNNICSQRDLYQERTSAEHPGCFEYDGRWEPARETTEEIIVKDAAPVRLVVRASRNGPIVDALLPPAAADTGPVSLRWMGREPSDEISCALDASRARSAGAFREALRGWTTPTWSFVFADVDGEIGYQCTGRLPIRDNWDRGYRPGWDPAHQWTSYIPFAEMPAVKSPSCGWVRSANNRTAPPDFPYPLSGTWSSGHRAQRVREMLEAGGPFSIADFGRMQGDTLSLRAVEAVPLLLELLALAQDDRLRAALDTLDAWNRRMDPGEAGAAIFELFFNRWCEVVAEARFAPAIAPLMAGAVGGLALSLLAADDAGWFGRAAREDAAAEAMRRALDVLESQLGADVATWTWGRIHTLRLRHALSGRGALGELLDRGGEPARGSGVTVCNTGYDPNYLASMGANYRLIVDLASNPPALWAVDAAGASGDPGSAHYCDQRREWLAGRYHEIALTGAAEFAAPAPSE
jgi:penicillin amidase